MARSWWERMGWKWRLREVGEGDEAIAELMEVLQKFTK